MLIYNGDNRIFNNKDLETLQQLINKDTETDVSYTTTYSYKIEKYLSSKGITDIMDIVNSILTLTLNIIYCVSTYKISNSTSNLFSSIEILILSVQLCHYLLKLYISQTRLYFISSIETFIDLGTIIPLLLLNFDLFEEELVFYIRTLKIGRFLYLYKLEYILQKKTNETVRFMYKLIFNLLSVIFISSALILEFENSNIRSNYMIKSYVYQSIDYDNDFDLYEILYKYHDILYFMLVTLSTIGYGDITPRTVYGRFIVVFTILLVLSLIPTLTSKLFAVLNLQSKYSRNHYRKISKQTKHLILLGNSTLEGYESFFNELYHEDHGYVDYHTVIMQNNANEELMIHLKQLPYIDKIYYLVGNSLLKTDLERCKAESSLCVILLADKLSKNQKLEDFSNILQAFSIKKYSKIQSGCDVRICMQLLRPESKEVYFQSLLDKEDLNSKDQVICVEEIKLLLLGKSCLCPGINTIISSLITSTKPKLTDVNPEPKSALYEYLFGMQYEIYRLKMKGNVIDGVKFNHLVKIIYDISGLVLIGVDCQLDQSNQLENDQIVSINPFNYVFYNSDHVVYVLADRLPIEEFINEEVMKLIKPEEREVNPDSHIMNIKKKAVKHKEDKDFNIHINKLRSKDSLTQKPKFIQTVYPRTGHESEHFSLEILSNHIIVVGLIQNMKSLIMPLRSLGNKNQQYSILIFDKEEHIFSEIWKDIQFFPDVFYMQGNPIKAKDLIRAGIKRARAVIILSKSFESSDTNGEMIDADIIFIYKAIRNENKHVLIITELASISTIGFLSSNENNNQKQYRLSEQFAVGEIYTNSMLDTLMCQAFYNPYITKIIQQLILGSAMYNYSTEELIEMQKRKISHSTLYLLNIYEEFERWNLKTKSKIVYYKDLFQSFIEKNMVPIGVYRGSKHEIIENNSHNFSKYVFLMPSKYSEINIETDRIYVLASEDETEKMMKSYNKTKDLTNVNSFFMKQLEKSKESACKISESLKEIVNMNQSYFNSNFSVKKMTDFSRLCIRKELIRIHDYNLK